MRRSGLRTGAGLLIIALGVLVTWWAWSASTHTHRVLALRSTVYRGQTITAADLTEVAITLDPTLKSVPATTMDAVVGADAKTDLPAGSILPAGSWARDTIPSGRTRVVGVTVTAAQLPSQPIHPGDQVQMVLTARPGDDPSNVKHLQSLNVVVHAVSSGTTQQGSVTTNTATTRLDVLIDVSHASMLARWAAAGRVSVILVSGAS